MKIRELRDQLKEHKKKFAPTKSQDSAQIKNYIPQNRMIQAGLEPYTGPWTKREANHLAKRTMFGASKTDVQILVDAGFNNAVNQLLQNGPERPLPINNYNDENFTDSVVDWGETWVNQPFEDDEAISRRIVSLKGWWIQQMIDQSLSIEEKMVYFWHNHLVSESWGVFWADSSWNHFKLFRDHSLGNFKELVYQITIDPAMLIYLNGFANNKDQPDENYARELQELFCIGKGANANYTEDDVKAMARILTGWSINWEDRSRTWYNWAHDTGNKEFSAFYSNRVIAGRSGTAGQEETQELIDMIFGTQESAFFLCRKLYRFFVYHDIDFATEQNVIVPMAQILRDNNYEILPVLDALFKSQHFYTDQNIGAMIKSPLDFIVGFWRSLNVQYPAEDIRTKYHIHTHMIWNMSNMGQEVLDPPNVAGWPAFYQIPQFDKQWVTTETIPNRAISTDSFVYWGYWSESLLTNVDLFQYVADLDNPSEPNALISEVCENLLGTPLTDTERGNLKSILLSGQMSDHYWTDAYLSYINDPTNEGLKSIIEWRLKPFFQRFFQLAEFQLT